MSHLSYASPRTRIVEPRRFFHRVVEFILALDRDYRERRQIETLSQEILDDIGISRGDIAQQARLLKNRRAS